MSDPLPSRFGDPPPLRRRAASMLLALAITLLILFAFVAIGVRPELRPEFRGRTVLVDLAPETETEVDAPKTATNETRVRPKAAPVVPPPPTPPPPPPPEEPPPEPSPYILLSKSEYEAFEKANPRPSRAPAAAAQPAQTGPSAGAGRMAGDSQPVGTAPNGEPLYEAQWYRKPTRAELATYLPPNMPAEGSGLIACRTMPRYRVDDCVELGSFPPGSRLAGAVRQAAWQFRVRPPRRGGKELFGTWVRIRIDYSTVARE